MKVSFIFRNNMSLILLMATMTIIQLNDSLAGNMVDQVINLYKE